MEKAPPISVKRTTQKQPDNSSWQNKSETGKENLFQ
jgi:hypothetical protein